MKKYIKIISIILVICTLFSGCSFRLASSIDDLVSPISPFGENADIQQAMDSSLKHGYSLKVPSNGENMTSYSFFDIDGDNNDEAFAFYEPSDDLGNIYMAVLQKGSNGWSVVQQVKGDGKDVYSLGFADINGDSKNEIIVCWDVISNSSNHVLSIYKYSSKDDVISLSSIESDLTINNYICVDMNKDNYDELLVFYVNSGNNASAGAELFTLKNNKLKSLGETKLDSHISTYSSLQIEEADNEVRVYADALGSDGSTMLSEIIYFSDRYDSLVSPFYSYSTGLTKETSRNALVVCQDVDDDGKIEFPTNKSVKKLPKQVKALDWRVYNKANSISIHKVYSLLVERDKYLVLIPNDYFDKISVSYNSDEREMTIKNKSTKKTVFSIMPVLKAVYSKSKYSDYVKVTEDSGYYYLAKLGNDSDIKISEKELKTLIKGY